MASRLAHRGPDDSGEWTDPTEGIALGHRRLSILDLSLEGHQPMHSSTGREVLVFNGEIYNHRELRSELEAAGQSFRGTSDTEVALAAISKWGVDDAVTRFNGMFALAVWDRKERKLSLVRDRIGIKPLYFGWVGSRFVFSSELKAMTCLSDFSREVDRDALASFFHYGYVPAPQCIYRGIEALQPATVLHLDGIGWELREPRTRRYWSVETALRSRRRLDAEDAADELENLLRDAVRLRMMADVPVGAFLSGGIDSSLVVALMQAQSARPIRTFTIGFREDRYNEAPYAAEVASQLGTDHTELYLSADEAMEVIPSIPETWDEPFADSSQIPMYLVSKLAREHVTVALSGDGGDELFGGYTRYAAISNEWRRSRQVPLPLRRLLGRAARWTASPNLDWLRRSLLPILRSMAKPTDNLQQRILWRAHAWSQADLSNFYLGHAAFAINPRVEEFLNDGSGTRCGKAERYSDVSVEDPIERMMLLDLDQYLPDDILTKVDRASMAVSLEARVPILDHRVVEFAWKTPFEQKIRRGVGKAVLRNVLGRHLPEVIFERPKMGFGIPFGEWMRGPLRGWAEDLLAPSRLGESGLFEVEWTRDRWLEHVAGTYDHCNLFWPILVFESWRRHWKIG